MTTRERITSPRTTATRARGRTAAAEIDAQTAVGETYVDSLIRAQLRLAGAVILALAVSIGLLPLLFVLLPRISRVHVLGVPAPWAVMGFAVYPALIGLAWFYVRRAERGERTFVDMLRADEDEQSAPR